MSTTMERLTLNVPKYVHKTIKSYAVFKGQSMTNVVLGLVDKFMPTIVQEMQQNQVDSTLDDNTIEKLVKFYNYDDKTQKLLSKPMLTEEEADALLIPYLIKQVEGVKNGTIKTRTWEEFEAELEQKKI